ncbi:hypothetical protein [Frigoriflavimonas asaccharolytica]|uniref:Uncharacterized protein n=1 Tax=Frigoriflavimonas asaccharolytica TaxID=2735899 RepID=A0A8J8GAY1_9FLAO|nr:hypothetical protein [Frigoriflavimonas asaccharolytica]NRS93875.1 hypothetical protein [Frigoriflavimonas asaccharolytica]
MKTILTFVFIIICSTKLFSQELHIKQSAAFEDILLAVKTDSISLFKNSFGKDISEEIMTGKGENIWVEGFNAYKDLLKKDFSDFQISDFSYIYDEKRSTIKIFYKGKKYGSMEVIEEEDKWKLNER